MKAWMLLLLLAVGNFLHIIDRNIMSLFIPVIRQDMGLSATEAGLITGVAFVAIYSVVAIPISRLADLRGPHRIIAASLFVWSTATYLCGSAGGFIALFAFRMSVGAGESGFTPSAHSAIAALFTREKLGKALSIFSLGAASGQIIGYTLSGIFADSLGWRSTFHILGAAGVVLSLVIWFAWPRLAPDAVASVRAPVERAPFFATLAGLFRIPAYSSLLLGAVLHAIAAFGVVQWIPSFLHEQHGMSTKEIGVYMGLILSIPSILVTFGMGFAIDRIRKDKLAICMRLSALSVAFSVPFYLLTFLAADLVGVWTLIPAFMLAALYQIPTYFTLQNLVPAENRAAANAVVLTLFSVMGLGLGPLLTGAGSDILEAMGVGTHLGIAMSAVATLNLISFFFFRQADRTLRGQAHA